jgi:TRAP-type C4-dicarboxylate transport system substrate-binding protein
MKKDKMWLGLTIGLMAMFLVSFPFEGSAQSAGSPIVIKCAAMAPRDMPVMLGFEAWGKEIEKRTNGRVKFEFYWAASLLKAGDELKGTGAGIADASIDVPAYHPSDTPLGTIGELGFMTSKVDAVARAMTDLIKENAAFREQYEKHNVKIMSFVPFPPNILGSTKPIKTLDDLKGKKVRALGMVSQVMAGLGGTPVAIPVPELFESMTRGVVDGFTGFPLNGVKGFKLHEAAKYYLDFGYGNYLTEVIIFNKNRFDSLPPDIQKIISDVSAETVDIYVDLYLKEEPRYVTPLKEAGCNFYTLPSADVEKWKSLVLPALWDGWVEKHQKGGATPEFFKRFVQLVKKYEPQSKYVNPFPK